MKRWWLLLASVLLALALASVVSAEEAPRGLTWEGGKLYYYQDDGTLFTEGYKEVTQDGVTRYYYFQTDGTAFTGSTPTFKEDKNR